MYSYIKGTVEEIYLDRIVLENNGIGYEINVSSFTAQSVQKGKDAKIFTKLIVREDDMSLCGFASRKELEMFKLLTSVSKIGPKVGLGILSCATPPQLSAYILSEDIAKLSKCPGVGKKTAERIILELKDKVDKESAEFEATLFNQAPTGLELDEAVEALLALGYSNVESKEAVQKFKKDGLKTEDLIKNEINEIEKTIKNKGRR